MPLSTAEKLLLLSKRKTGPGIVCGIQQIFMADFATNGYVGAQMSLPTVNSSNIHDAGQTLIAVNTLNAALATGTRIILNANGTRQWYQWPSTADGHVIGALNVQQWKDNLLDFYTSMIAAGVDIPALIAARIIVAYNCLDESQDGGQAGNFTGWGGAPVPAADYAACIAYAQSLWPTMYVGAQNPSSYNLPMGPPYGGADYIQPSYNSKAHTTIYPFSTWFAGQADDCDTMGIALFVNINVLSGGSTGPVTISNGSPGVFTTTYDHGLQVAGAAGDWFVLSTTGTLPTGLTPGTHYFVSTVPTSKTFTVSASFGGADVNTSSAGSGVHTYTYGGSNILPSDFVSWSQTMLADPRLKGMQIYRQKNSGANPQLDWSAAPWNALYRQAAAQCAAHVALPLKVPPVVGAYSPSLDLSDARNSMYLTLGV